MLRFAANVSWLFRDAAPLERPAAARRAGFLGIELHSLEGFSACDWRQAAESAGVAVVLLNASSGDYHAGGPGLLGVSGREREFARALDDALTAAGEARIPIINVGASRYPKEADRLTHRANFVARLREGCSAAAAHGVMLTLEPLNRREHPDAIVAQVNTALKVIEEVDSANLGLQFDTYHIAMNGQALVDVFHRAAPFVRHVQFSDMPGRHEPGTGELDFARFFGALEAADYAGWVSAEYHPVETTVRSLGWFALCH